MKVVRLLCLIGLALLLANCSQPKNFAAPTKTSPSQDTLQNDNSDEVDDILDEITEPPEEPAVPADRTAAIRVATDEVTKIYDEVLDRTPDQPGLDYWVAQVIDQGQLISQVRNAIARSDESMENILELACTFFNSCSDENLKRAIADFLAINGTLDRSREIIDEMVVDEITEYYDAYLNREPDTEGLEFWSNAAKNGVTKSRMIQYFLASDEYQIRRLYLDLMKREPDAEGFRYWLDRAKDGMTIPQIRQSFLNSTEYQIREIYRQVLGREADEPGLAYWIDRHEVGGMTIAQIRTSIENSDEAKMRN